MKAIFVPPCEWKKILEQPLPKEGVTAKAVVPRYFDENGKKITKFVLVHDPIKHFTIIDSKTGEVEACQRKEGWGNPGGGVKCVDGVLGEGLLRELSEELNIPKNRISIQDIIEITRKRNGHLDITYVVGTDPHFKFQSKVSSDPTGNVIELAIIDPFTDLVEIVIDGSPEKTYRGLPVFRSTLRRIHKFLAMQAQESKEVKRTSMLSLVAA